MSSFVLLNRRRNKTKQNKVSIQMFQVTATNVERLLPVADQFHVLGLVKQCCDFLEKHLDWDNCIGIRNFAHTYNCDALESKANRFILERLDSLNDAKIIEI